MYSTVYTAEIIVGKYCQRNCSNRRARQIFPVNTIKSYRERKRENASLHLFLTFALGAELYVVTFQCLPLSGT
jgi:hypothetical protein